MLSLTRLKTVSSGPAAKKHFTNLSLFYTHPVAKKPDASIHMFAKLKSLFGPGQHVALAGEPYI